MLRACRLMNDSEKYIVAVDVPTGVNADNGAVSENAVRADKTVTMALLKTGLLLYPAVSIAVILSWQISVCLQKW